MTTTNKEEQAKALELVMASIEKQFGKGALITLKDEEVLPGIDCISTGSISIDRALGGRGMPRGRIVEVYGPESCLDQDTFIQFEVKTKTGKRQNHKGGTIKRLFERFHHIEADGQGYYQHQETIDSEFYVPSINEEGRVFQNKVADVVSTGQKPCLEIITESGYKLTCTSEHKIFTDTGFRSAGELQTGDICYIHNCTPFKKEHKPIRYKEVYVKYHPQWPTKTIDKKYAYHRSRKSRATYEAFMNNMSLNDYLIFLNTKDKSEINKLNFIPNGFDVHHKDENFTNDNISNLELLPSSEHYKHHALKNHNNLRYMVVPEQIVSIQTVGIRNTYDIKCIFPYNNYIANNIVVHNCGKTTLTLEVIANAQKAGGVCAFLDAEHALDIGYAKNLGVDVDNLLLSQPDTSEQCLEIADMLVSSGAVDVIVIDSVAAMVPRAELEGEMGDAHVGLQARLMSQALRKLTGKVSQTNTLIIFINQIRMKIGVMFGNPETTSGGNALKFYASQRIDIRRIGQVKDGENIIGNATKIKVVKNKIAPPFREVEFNIMYGKGIDKCLDCLRLAVDANIVEKSGAWYAFEGERIAQGEGNSVRFLEEHPDIYQKIIAKLNNKEVPAQSKSQ